MVQQWKVVGGADKGGITVREGKATTSKQNPLKLATDAIVEELELVGDRLHFKRISGAGPDSGWVSVSLKEKVLLTKVDSAAPGAADKKPEAPAAKAPAAEEKPPEKPSGLDADMLEQLSAEVAPPSAEISGAPVYEMTKEELEKACQEADGWWMDAARKKPAPADVTILQNFLTGSKVEVGLEEPRDYKGGQLPVMPRTIGLPTYAAVPDNVKKSFPERPVRKPMIRLYCFPGAADNYMLWIEMATAAPEWCEVAIFEPRAHGFRPNEPWDKNLEQRAEDAFRVMRPAFETHARGGISEGAPFGFLSHGVGGQFMALIAQKLKRELSLEPLVIFANDGPPPNVNTLTPEAYALLCSDMSKFYQTFQPNTSQQVERLGGKDSKQGQALLQKWSRGLRLFEEHTYRCQKMEDPIYHKFNCDLHVLVARHSVDGELEIVKQEKMGKEILQKIYGKDFAKVIAQIKKDSAARAKFTACAPEVSANWDREQFKKWKEWTTEDFYYHELETDHGSIKNHKLMRDLVFKELSGFCGMDYRP